MDHPNNLSEARRLSDDAVHSELLRARNNERRAMAWFIACLAEADRRRLYLPRGFSSIFSYCTDGFGLSGDDAYRKIRVMKAATFAPEILVRLSEGSLTITGAALLSSVLKPSNAESILAQSSGKSTRAIAGIVAKLSPKKSKPDQIRNLGPQPAEAGAPDDGLPLVAGSSAPSATHSVSPMGRTGAIETGNAAPEISNDRIHFSFMGTEELSEYVARLKALLWHRFPEGRLGDLLLEAARDYIKRNAPAARLDSEGPRTKKRESNPRSRRIPGWVKDQVRLRDGSRCAFVAPDGRRCEETRGLEFDHITPWALGGASNHPDNVRLLCAAHNRHEARVVFGDHPGV